MEVHLEQKSALNVYLQETEEVWTTMKTQL